MSSSLSKRLTLPQLSRRWTGPDSAAAQGDRTEGDRAGREGVEPDLALRRFWQKLAAEGAGDLLRLYGECHRLREDQDARTERLRHELDQETVGLAAANQRQHDERLGSLRRELGPEAAPYRQAAARSEDGQKALRAIRAEVNARPLRSQPHLLYLFIMAVLALAEVPVNRAAFELTFREEPVFSLLLAMAVGIVLIFFAHVIGLILRQWPRRPRLGAVALRLGALGVILAAVGAGIYFMARMRQAYMRLTAAENDGFAQRLQEALRGGARETVQVMQDLPLSFGDWTFIAINILLFLFGIAASFLRHDPHPDYEKAMRESQRADKGFARHERRYATALSEETARYEERKRALETQMSDLRATIAAVSDQTVGIARHCQASLQMVAQTIRTRCGNFVDGYNAAGAARIAAVPTLEAIIAELPRPEPDRGP